MEQSLIQFSLHNFMINQLSTTEFKNVPFDLPVIRQNNQHKGKEERLPFCVL